MNGDLVFYKREGREKWLGPGKVVFQDGKVVFVRHGSVFVRVSPNRLCKINSLEYDKDESAHESVSNENADTQKGHKGNGEHSKILTETDTDSQIISADIPAEIPRQAVEAH